MATLRLDQIHKSFGNTPVLTGVSFEVAPGELLVLRAPSGTGKTTLLRIIAGLETADQGQVYLAEQPLPHTVPPHERNIGMVFQDFALWPHMRAEQHLNFVMKAKGVPKEERTQQIDELLSFCGISERRRAYPAELSGGQQQRLSLARALVGRPQLLLLDEAFSNIEPELGMQLLKGVRERAAAWSAPIILATHDDGPILELADQIINIGE